MNKKTLSFITLFLCVFHHERSSLVLNEHAQFCPRLTFGEFPVLPPKEMAVRNVSCLRAVVPSHLNHTCGNEFFLLHGFTFQRDMPILFLVIFSKVWEVLRTLCSDHLDRCDYEAYIHLNNHQPEVITRSGYWTLSCNY